MKNLDLNFNKLNTERSFDCSFRCVLFAELEVVIFFAIVKGELMFISLIYAYLVPMFEGLVIYCPTPILFRNDFPSLLQCWPQ